ncbi:hypothetical protein [Roseisolibacter sp. H3M3-2]|uniref:hypothetical protein n=1 Tax=Roseisolibacter sp. H3M3-2 TaxID=3031323 RepID=UPI0023DC84F1|nr:hypothetical protein [Roseisolibacter sp. H3M3-2]MDF1505339.1 hypothetical protein [Roseisolibacter sp. H3M3-2]
MRARRRHPLVAGAIAYTTALALAASLGVGSSWRPRRAPARQAVVDHLLFTAHVVGDELARASADRRWPLLVPVLGRGAGELAGDSALATFDAHAARTLDGWGLGGDRWRGTRRKSEAKRS